MSMDKPYIKMSPEIFNALKLLKEFNYKNIYAYSYTNEEKAYYKEGMEKIFKRYVRQLDNKEEDSNIYKYFYNSKSDEYKNNTSSKRVAIDYIAGMTDDFFMNEISIEK